MQHLSGAYDLLICGGPSMHIQKEIERGIKVKQNRTQRILQIKHRLVNKIKINCTYKVAT